MNANQKNRLYELPKIAKPAQWQKRQGPRFDWTQIQVPLHRVR